GTGSRLRRRASAVVDLPAPGAPATTQTSAGEDGAGMRRSLTRGSTSGGRAEPYPPVLSPYGVAYGRGVTLPPLIPRSVLFGNPDHASPSVSPDGRLLGYVAPLDGV